MVAVLHHLDLADTLARIPGLLAPGGRLLVVGLARVDSPTDLAVDLISAAANPVMGLIRHPRPARPTRESADGQPLMPIRAPATTLADIRAGGQNPPARRRGPTAPVLPVHPALGQPAITAPPPATAGR